MNAEIKNLNKVNNIIPAFIKCVQYGIRFDYSWELDKYVYGKSLMFVIVDDAIGQMSHLYNPSDEMVARNMSHYNKYALLDLEELKIYIHQSIMANENPQSIGFGALSEAMQRIQEYHKLIIKTDNLTEDQIRELLKAKQS